MTWDWAVSEVMYLLFKELLPFLASFACSMVMPVVVLTAGLFLWRKYGKCCSAIWRWYFPEIVAKELKLPDVPLGFFYRDGVSYYRPSYEAPLLVATPTSLVSSFGSPDSPRVTFTLAPTLPQEKGSESVLPFSPPIRMAPDEGPKWLVQLGLQNPDGTVMPVGFGFREQDWLITARHIRDLDTAPAYQATKLVLYKGSRMVEAQVLEVVNVSTEENYEFSGHDLQALRFAPSVFASLQIGSVNSKTFTATAAGQVAVYGTLHGLLAVAEGALRQDEKLNAAGVQTHAASTLPGFSGSPLVVNQNGSFQIAGLHISAAADGKPCNYGVSYWAIQRLRRKLGLSQTTKFEKLYSYLGFAESREAGARQGEWSDFELDDGAWADASKDAEVEAFLFENLMHSNQGKTGMDAYREVHGRSGGRRREPRSETVDLFTITQEEIPNHEARLQLWFEKLEDLCPGRWVRSELVREFTQTGRQTFKQYIDKVVGLEHRAETLEGRTFHYYRYQEPLDDEEVGDVVAPLASESAAPGLSQSVTLQQAAQRSLRSRAAFGQVSQTSTLPDVMAMSHLGDKYWKDRANSPVPRAAQPFESFNAYPEYPYSEQELERCFRTYVDTRDPMELLSFLDAGSSRVLGLKCFDEYRVYLAAGSKERCKLRGLGQGVCMRDKASLPFLIKAGRYAENGTKPDVPMKTMDKDTAEWVEQHLGVQMTDPELDGKYVMPASGKAALTSSLRHQAGRQTPGSWSHLQAAMDEKLLPFFDSFPRSKNPLLGWGEHFDTIVDEMDGDKSAGWSSRYRSGTKSYWKDHREALFYLVSCRLVLRLADATLLYTLDPLDMVERGLADPREAFVKSEPHDADKAKSSRWRVIWGISIVDSVLQALLHRRQNKADMAAFQAGRLNCVAGGLGHHDEGITRLGAAFEWISGEEADNITCNDASGWDLSVSRDAIFMDNIDRRAHLCCIPEGAHVTLGCECGEEISNLELFCDFTRVLLGTEACCNTAHVLAFGGQLWECQVFGLTASGIPSTTAQNSSVRSLQALLCGAKRALAVGDDLLYSGSVDIRSVLKCGTLAKEELFSPPEGPIDFTSHLFRKRDGVWCAEFDNYPKLLARLIFNRNSPTFFESVCGALHCVRASPDKVAGVLALAERLNPAETKDYEPKEGFVDCDF